MADKAKFEDLSLQFTSHQTSINLLINARSQLETQLQENKIVLAEFEHLNENSKIYKLTGPVLMPQEYGEAKLNVSKRLEFIEGEIKRVESKISDEEKALEKLRDELYAMRANFTN